MLPSHVLQDVGLLAGEDYAYLSLPVSALHHSLQSSQEIFLHLMEPTVSNTQIGLNMT